MRFATAPPLCSDHGKAVEQVILIVFPGIGVLLADGDHSPVDADKFFSAEIIHIFKVYDIGAVDPVKGFWRELLLQVRDISFYHRLFYTLPQYILNILLLSLAVDIYPDYLTSSELIALPTQTLCYYAFLPELDFLK